MTDGVTPVLAASDPGGTSRVTRPRRRPRRSRYRHLKSISSRLGAVLVVGCGNLLRGDDGGVRAGPPPLGTWVPDGARLVDGGTATWMSPSRCGRAAGGDHRRFRNGGAAGNRPPTPRRGTPRPAAPAGSAPTRFRWDHAILLARWALGERPPSDITVFLIEAANVAWAPTSSEPVEKAMEEGSRWCGATSSPRCGPRSAPRPGSSSPPTATCDWDAAPAASRFPSDAVAAGARRRPVADPLRGAA